MIANLLSSAWVERLGWALLHFVWQGAAIAVVLVVVLRFARNRSANFRYAAACVALAVMALAPVVTFFVLGIGAENKSEIAEVVVEVPGGDEEAFAASIARVTAPLGASAPQTEPRANEMPIGPEDGPRANFNFPALSPRAGQVFAAAWFAGVLILSVRLLGGFLRARRFVRHDVAPLGSDLQAGVSEISNRLGISRVVRLLESSIARVPMTIGWLKPVIVLPTWALTGLTPDQLAAIVAHELAHIRRHDYVVNLAQSVIETLLFYHPAVWWVSSRIRAEREHCCDDLAIAACGNRATLAHALTKIEEYRATLTPHVVAASGGVLRQRVERILGSPKSHEPNRWIAGAIALAVLALAFTALYVPPAGIAQEEQSQKAAKTWGDELPNGITVDFIGVTKGDEFWRPDGTLISGTELLGVDRNLRNLDSTVGPYRFVFRISNLIDAEIRYELPQSPSSGIWQSADHDATDEEGLWIVGAQLDDTAPKTIRLLAAKGEWSTRFVHLKSKAVRDVAYGGDAGGVVFKKPISRDGKTMLPVVHSYTRLQPRLVATTKWLEGVLARQSSFVSVHDMNTIDFEFDRPLSEIEEFIFQTRSFDYAEFRNVSVKPGEHTQVEIKTGRIDERGDSQKLDSPEGQPAGKSHLESANSELPPIEFIRAAFARRSGALGSFAVSWQSRTFTPKGANDDFLKGMDPSTPTNPREDITAFESGKLVISGDFVRADTLRDIGKELRDGVSGVNIFRDGIELMFQEDKQSGSRAHVQSRNPPGVGDSMGAGRIFAAIGDINYGTWEVARREKFQGKELVVVGTPQSDWDKSGRRIELFLDPAQDYSIQRKLEMNSDGRVMGETRYEYERNATIGWIPTRATYTTALSFGAFTDITIGEFELDPEIRDDFFSFELPMGTKVDDAIQNKSYVVQVAGDANRWWMR